MLLTLTGRKSGREFTFPVNYRRHDSGVLCGADFPWWRNLVEEPRVRVLINGTAYEGEARIIDRESDQFEPLMRKLRPRTLKRAMRINAVLIEVDLSV